VYKHEDQFDSATSRMTREVLTACRQSHGIAIFIPETPGLSFQKSENFGI